MNIEIETVLMLKYIDVIYQDFPRFLVCQMF